jgi:release factor glutamine methyltransferase
MTWAQLQADAAVRLASGPEARWLVEEVTGEQWPAALTSPSAAVSQRAKDRFEALVARRAAGEPLQYVLGRWQFRTLDLMLDQRVLIPRPETEQVVEVALAELGRTEATEAQATEAQATEAQATEAQATEAQATEAMEAIPTPEATDQHLYARRGRRNPVAVDLGTGSGAIALSLAAERPRLEVWGTDVSVAALDVATANLAGLGGRAAARVRLASGIWWAALPDHLRGGVDLVVSNPPYVSSGEMTDLDAEVVDWEPRLSLEAGPTGLEAIGEILNGASAWLRSSGAIVVEIAPHQAKLATEIARDAGFAEVDVRTDLAGRDRVLVARGPT